jgi:superfamily I DNA and/or RNA helicase
LQTLSPKVLVVEEAGQALEAHILAALSPSIQHLIQIGDPQQLRCITNCHKLSVETNIGSTHYRLNESMMERLSSAGYPMAQLKTQRRMRPKISALIRAQLYPELKDHERVLEYPAVQGATKNVYFL